MKLAGFIAVLISTSSVGLMMYENSRIRLRICRELVVLCEAVKRDFMYKSTPVNLLIAEIISNSELNHLSFIDSEVILSEKPLKSPLSAVQNRELSAFLNSLGKSDTATQLELIDSFCDYISKEEEKQRICHAKNARIYLTFGVFSGALIVLMFV